MNVAIHKVTGVKCIVSEERDDIMGRKYRLTKILVETEHGPNVEVDLFGRGLEIEAIQGNETMVEVYPMVELERPDVVS